MAGWFVRLSTGHAQLCIDFEDRAFAGKRPRIACNNGWAGGWMDAPGRCDFTCRDRLSARACVRRTHSRKLSLASILNSSGSAESRLAASIVMRCWRVSGARSRPSASLLFLGLRKVRRSCAEPSSSSSPSRLCSTRCRDARARASKYSSWCGGGGAACVM
eukprot:351135-Chlamydomonas_euryale.AAC.1